MDRIVNNNIVKYVKYIQKFIDVKKAILYGSYARGNYTKNSDIDIAIFVKKNSGKNYMEIQKLLFKLRRKFDLRIEPSLFYIEQSKINEPASFVNNIIKTGHVIITN